MIQCVCRLYSAVSYYKITALIPGVRPCCLSTLYLIVCILIPYTSFVPSCFSLSRGIATKFVFLYLRVCFRPVYTPIWIIFEIPHMTVGCNSQPSSKILDQTLYVSISENWSHAP